MANEAQIAFDEAAPEAVADAAREAAAELRRAAPVASGELASSIRAEGEYVVAAEHAMWIDLRGRHRGWIGRATGGEVVY